MTEPACGASPAYRIGVVVVAYNAEKTVDLVLGRIPTSFWERCAGVWVSDDGSTDSTHDVAHGWWMSNAHHPVTLVRQHANLGYGGNQKAGYRWAIENGLDAVVLLHGDGQYAPEIIDEIVAPIERGEADAVMGSRMLTAGGARRGRMPLYKLVGNRILTRFQNAVTGADLSEWHSGYRAFSVSALAELPFSANSDDFDFDTEILLQLMSAGKRIAEVPIPTYYGGEISHVNGLKYAADVVADTVAWRLNKAGFGAGHLAQAPDDYVMHQGASGAHQQAIERLRGLPASRILDVGCGAGYVAEVLTQLGHEVVGIDVVERPHVATRMAQFVRADVGAGLPAGLGEFDVVLAADVLEHLVDPARALRRLAEVLRPGGFVLVSVPNVAHWYPRIRSAVGHFDYDQRGILDATHLRFFTRRSLGRLCRTAGYRVRSLTPVGLPVDLLGPGSRLVARPFLALQRVGLRIFPRLFAYQFLAELVVPSMRATPTRSRHESQQDSGDS